MIHPLVPVLFQIFRWAVILTLLAGGFAVLYYYGTNVQQKFKYITPGALVGVLGLVGVSLLFRVYVSNFGDYSASYGSLGAVVVLMLWFYFAGVLILLGSEINALIEDGPTKKQSVADNASFKLKTPPENPLPEERAAATTSGTTSAPTGSRP